MHIELPLTFPLRITKESVLRSGQWIPHIILIHKPEDLVRERYAGFHIATPEEIKISADYHDWLTKEIENDPYFDQFRQDENTKPE